MTCDPTDTYPRIAAPDPATPDAPPGRPATPGAQRVLNYRVDGLPDGAIYIGLGMPRRRLAGSRFGNPFKISPDGDRSEVIERYRRMLCDAPELVEAAKRELRGRDLVCWCAPDPCHGDVLLEIANGADGVLGGDAMQTIGGSV
jgi:hypothetical protein